MKIIKIISIIVLILSVCWIIASPGYEPIISLFLSISGLIASYKPTQEKKSIKQKQSVTDNSFGIQAGHKINIDNEGSNNEE